MMEEIKRVIRERQKIEEIAMLNVAPIFIFIKNLASYRFILA